MGSACYSGDSFDFAHINPRIKRQGTSRQIGASAAAKELAVDSAQGAEKKLRIFQRQVPGPAAARGR
jgi:hypothetical protein